MKMFGKLIIVKFIFFIFVLTLMDHLMKFLSRIIRKLVSFKNDCCDNKSML